MAQTAQTKKDHALKSIETMKDDVAQQASNAAGAAREQASELQETIVRGASDLAETVNTRLKAVGVDTGVMVDAAKDQAGELSRLIGEELKARPLRALGIAAALGLVVGLLSAR